MNEFLLNIGKGYAKDLTDKATKWEVEFKKKLIAIGVEFIFQYPIVCADKHLYILDFYLPEYHLAIELDGKGHYTKKGIRKDKIRTHHLKKEGIQVMRFSNAESKAVTTRYIKDLLDLINKY